jgi:hypothetical protein
MATSLLLASSASLEAAPGLVIFIPIIIIGMIGMFDFRGWRKALFYADGTYEEFLAEQPSKAFLVKIIGAGFLVGGSILLVGISIGMIISS